MSQYGPGQEPRWRRLTRYGIVAGIVLVVGGLALARELRSDGAPVQTAQRVAVGEPAPDFWLESPDGPFRLSETRGDVVIVNFWATWCGPCRFEMPEFQGVHHTRGEPEGIRIVAVNLTSSDSREGAMNFVEEYGLTFTIAFDETGGVAGHYGVRGLPATFFIDREGILRSRVNGPVLGDRLEENIRLAGG
ncbi:MAG: TlpA family protein disulfide reductase [Dehalococcoidia bacterium]|nr:TlpA family protein disulfide reductase [Dehalococcoidia bacterium]